MKRTTLGILLLLLATSAGGLLIAGREGQEKVSQAKLAVTKAEQERLLAVGKKLFVERCAKCHEERGDKPLKTGAPLKERNLLEEQITRAVSGRFRDKSEEEKRRGALHRELHEREVIRLLSTHARRAVQEWIGRSTRPPCPSPFVAGSRITTT